MGSCCCAEKAEGPPVQLEVEGDKLTEGEETTERPKVRTPVAAAGAIARNQAAEKPRPVELISSEDKPKDGLDTAKPSENTKESPDSAGESESSSEEGEEEESDEESEDESEPSSETERKPTAKSPPSYTIIPREAGNKEFTPVKKKEWAYRDLKLPKYSAGGPGKSDVPDPFKPPDIGHACYLVFSDIQSGSLKLHYAKSTDEVKDRIIGAAVLTREAQGFKYKTPTTVGTTIYSNPGQLFRAVSVFVRVCHQFAAETTYYPLPPSFPPFVVAYHFSNDQVKLQYAGEDSVKVEGCDCAAVGDPVAMKNIQAASKANYHVFKLQFINTDISNLIDFAKD